MIISKIFKFFKPNIALRSIVLFSLLASFTVAHCTLENTKGTHNILTPDHKYLSLAHGANAWETGITRRLYDNGQIFPEYRQDNKGRKIISGYINPEQTHQTVRLIHVLFYRVPGSVGDTDFGVTKQLEYQDPVMIGQTMAKVLAYCQKIQADDQVFKKALTELATHRNLKDALPKLLANPLATTKKNRSLLTAFIGQCALFKKKKQPDYQQQVANVEVITRFCQNLGSIQRLLGGLLKFQALLGANMGQVVLASLRECDPNNPDALYPKHMTQTILLEFLYKKCGNNRDALKAFYDELNKNLDSKVLVDNLDGMWAGDSFDAVTQAEALKAIQEIFAVDNPAQNLGQSLDKNFAELVYYSQQIRGFPAPVGYATAFYEYELGKKTEGFSNCMSNTMRNFINLYAYDVIENKFTITTLCKTMGLDRVHPALASFIQSFSDTGLASSPEAHNALLSVISNIPYVAYNRVVDGKTGKSTEALTTGKGYIAIPDGGNNWLAANGYQVIGQNQYGYELQPSLKNIIIVLNHLLALDLFPDIEGGLAQEFMRPDFIKVYFPKLCATLGATGFLATQKNAQEAELDKDFDALDYGQTKIYTTFALAGTTCEFATYSGHGELRLVRADGSEEEAELKILFAKIAHFADRPNWSFLATSVLCRQQINFDHLKNNQNLLYANLYAVALEDTGRLGSISGQTFSALTEQTPLSIKIGITDLLLRLAEKLPDLIQRQLYMLKILESFFKNLSSEDIETGAVRVLLELCVQAACKGIVDQNPSARDSSLNLFKALFEKNYSQAFATATEAACTGIVNQDWTIRRSALNLFKALVKNNFQQAFEKATEAAYIGIVDQGSDVRRSALNLFKTLFEKNYQQAFEKAIDAACTGIVDQKWKVRLSALDLFKTLFEKNYQQAFEKATEVACKGIVYWDQNVRLSALNLFKTLFEKNYQQAFATATEAACKGIVNKNANVRNSSLDLFKALFEKNYPQAFATATEAACKRIVNKNANVRNSALDLFKALFIACEVNTRNAIQKILNDPQVNLEEYIKNELEDLIKEQETKRRKVEVAHRLDSIEDIL